MRTYWIQLIVGSSLLAVSVSTWSAPDFNVDAAFQEIRATEQNGPEEDAFLKALALPGVEFVAAALGRSDAARAQLERRVATGPSKQLPDNATTSSAKPAVADGSAGHWVHVPEQVQLLVSCDNVLSFARDERFIYAGHPWGLAVYDFRGQNVARLALGDAVCALAAGRDELWAGTPKGLFRIRKTLDGWSVALQRLDGDVLPANSGGPADDWFNNSVLALALNGEQLWIGMHRNLQVLNTRTLELRAFSLEELKVTITNWGVFNRLVPDNEYVWADSLTAGLLRYDQRSETWEAIVGPLKQKAAVRLIGVIDGQVWGYARINEMLGDRPCVIDRETLKLTPVLIDGWTREHPRCPSKWFGRRQGKLVFGTEYPDFEYDPERGTLGPIRAFGERPSLAIEDQPDAGLLLPDGTRVFGRPTSTTRYQYPHEDHGGNVHDPAGGLFFVSRSGVTNRVSSAPEANTLPSDSVLNLLFDPDGDWLCTSGGLARMNQSARVIARFSRANGFFFDLVRDAAKLDGKYYFASASGNSGGGLIMLDPATGVFTSFQRADGLDSDKVERVEVTSDNQLRIYYGAERSMARSGSAKTFERYPPGLFDPKSRHFTSGGPPQLLTDFEAMADMRARRKAEPMPCLGGKVLQVRERDGKTFLCGTRGLVILHGPPAAQGFDPLGARVKMDPRVQWLAEARQYGISSLPLEQVKSLAVHTNAYIRANALASAILLKPEHQRDVLTLAEASVTDPFHRVRATAVWLLARVTNSATVGPLQTALKDTDPYIRAVAAVALARLGERPDLALFKEILEKNGYGNFPFGADTSIGVVMDKTRVYQALLPTADRDTFELLLGYPIESTDNEAVQSLFKTLGAALARNPNAVEVLLRARRRDARTANPVRFAQAVFKAAGKELLPIFHRALASQDRVVRSNAARACGTLGDSSSIPLLLEALEMESGLARASIVWALGELKAREAVPRLIQLYADASGREENRNLGAGHLILQENSTLREQYSDVRRLDESKSAAWRTAVDRREIEESLTIERILDAIDTIGGPAAQQFYRESAGAKAGQTFRVRARPPVPGKSAD